MVVQYKNKTYLFVHIGGNAGTSIEWYLYVLNNNLTFHPNKYSDGEYEYVEIIRDKNFQNAIDGHKTLGDYIKQGIKYDYSFAVIRNPYDRILAKFFASPQSKNITKNNARRIFADFVDEIYSYKTKFAKDQAIHTCCQSNYIFHGNRSVKILEFENLQQDFLRFCQFANLPGKELIRCNSTFHPLKSMNLYTDISRQKVYINNKTIIDFRYS